MSLCAEEMRGSSWRGSATASATTWLDSRCVDVCGCAQACQCVCFCALCLCCLCGCVACMLVRSSKWRVINAISLSLVAHGMPFHPPPPHRPSHHRCQSKVTARSWRCCWTCWWISWHHSVSGLIRPCCLPRPNTAPPFVGPLAGVSSRSQPVLCTVSHPTHFTADSPSPPHTHALFPHHKCQSKVTASAPPYSIIHCPLCC
jgi:hypothetical protein